MLFSGCITSAAEQARANSRAISLNKFLNNTNILNLIKKIDKKNQEIIKRQEIANANKQVNEEEIGIPVGEELLLSLYIDKYYIAELFAYKSKQNAQISLISLFELLDFPISVDVENRFLSGWFINEQNSFTLELPEQADTAATVIINEQKTSLSPENYYIEGEDIYVDADIIASWFAVTMDFNFTDLQVTVNSESPLPLQQKLAREKRKLRQKTSKEATLPWKPSNYQTVSMPMLDMQLYSSINKNKQVFYNYSLVGANDFAYLSSQYYLNGDKNNGISDLRLSFAKESENGDLLGPFNATSYKFGDITPVKSFGGSTGGISRGFKFTNRDVKKLTNNRTKTFSGNIQPGWDIELYRNKILIAQQFSSTEGRYDFNDIDLLFGNNIFELIFYGPQGQVRKEQQEFYIDSRAVNARSSSYAFSTVQTNKRLFNVSDSMNIGQAGWSSALDYQRGITDTLSLNGSLEYFLAEEGDDGQRYSLGSDFSLLERYLFNTSFRLDNKNNAAVNLGARTQFGGHSFNLNYDWATGLKESESQSIKFDMSGSLSAGTVPVHYSNSLKSDMETDSYGFKSSSYSAANQIVLPLKPATISNKVNYVISDLNEDFSNGALRIQTSLGPVYSRFTTNYEIQPEFKAKSQAVNLSMRLTEYLQSDLGFTYNMVSDYYRSELSLYWQGKLFNLNSTLNYDSNDNWSVGLNSRFSFGYEPTSKQFAFSNRSFAKNGSLMARVFEDEDLNGQYDQGERLLEDVKVKALQSHRSELTNKDGVAILPSLTKGKRTDIVIDRRTLDDPFLIPSGPGVSITPRSGFMEVIDIPLVNAGELDGTVYLRDKQGNEKAGAYLTINLTNSDGEIIATTETEFDGYYLFIDLLPGKYTLTIDAEDVKRKNLHDAEVLEFDFSAAGDVIAGADFVVQRYTFVKGYVVDLGRFNSLAMVKTYWQIIKTNYNNALQQQVFYSENKELQTFHLNAAFFKREAQAQRACNYLEEKGISCSVKEFEFNL